MRRLGNRVLLAALAVALALGGAVWISYDNQRDCCAYREEREKQPLGLMTSLPLYWPLGAGIEEIASGRTELPWQRQVLERRFHPIPLDTLTSIPALSPDEPDTDPLAGLEYLAVIQPRGLSPADNVALDEWVRAGGRLLLVLDPMLTGEYDMPLGDPRRPNDTALVPPVVARWGLSISYAEDTQSDRDLRGNDDQFLSQVSAYGEISTTDAVQTRCEIAESQVVAICEVGAGRVTLYADAAIFEDSDPESIKAEAILALMRTAFH